MYVLVNPSPLTASVSPSPRSCDLLHRDFVFLVRPTLVGTYLNRTAVAMAVGFPHIPS